MLYSLYKKDSKMISGISPFFLHWAILSLTLWIVSHVFSGVKFSSKSALIISALLLGFANAILRPLLIFLTFPLTIVTFGFFLLVINALMVLLVARLVRGFQVSGFWTAFFASIFISLCSFVLTWLTAANDAGIAMPSGNGVFI